MLSMPNSVKVLVSKDNVRGSCRGAPVKRTIVTAIECISADGRCLNPMIVWPDSTHRANYLGRLALKVPRLSRCEAPLRATVRATAVAGCGCS
jgi:hypothetical protein